MRATVWAAHMRPMKENIGLRPGAAEKMGLEVFVEVLTTTLSVLDTDPGFEFRLEAVAGALIQGIFEGVDDVDSLAYDAVCCQFTALTTAEMLEVSALVAATVRCL